MELPNRAEAEHWIRAYVTPVGPIETAHDRPWSTVLRVPVAEGTVWFKACGAVQAFEPRLTATLYTRWSDRTPVVLAADAARAWLLLADAGTPIGVLGNPPELWLRALPMYAELQRGEAAYAVDHLAQGVPDLQLATWPARYADLLSRDVPLEDHDVLRLRQFAPRFAELTAELAAYDIPASIQHDDLHMANVYTDGERLRIMDWGDSSISHPFASLVATFRFLDEVNRLPPSDPWFARLRDAYLEPWGPGLGDACALAERAGAFAHAFAWLRQRDLLPPRARPEFDVAFRIILRRAVARIAE